MRILIAALATTIGIGACTEPTHSDVQLRQVERAPSKILDDESGVGVHVALMDPPGWAAHTPWHQWPTFADHARYASMFKAANIRWMRVDMAMPSLWVNNQLQGRELERLDWTLRLAADSGFAVLGAITADSLVTQSAFLTYVTALLDFINGRVRYFNVLNEPNCRGYLSDPSAPGSAATGGYYATFVNLVAPEIHRFPRNGKVVAGEMAGVQNASPNCRPGSTFLGQFLNAVNPGAVDVISLHAYQTTSGAIFDEARRVHDTLVARDLEALPIWMTEFGMPENNPHPEWQAHLVSEVFINRPAYLKKAFFWHAYTWGANQDFRATLVPRDSTGGANGQPMYSNPIPTLTYLSFRNLTCSGGVDFTYWALCGTAPPLTAATIAPSSVRPHVGCWWRGRVTNGVWPFTYSWRFNSGAIVQAPEIRYVNSGSGFWTDVTTKDATNRTVTSSRFVTVSATAPPCVDPSITGTSNVRFAGHYSWTCRGTTDGAGGASLTWYRSDNGGTSYYYAGTGASYATWVDYDDAPVFRLRCVAMLGGESRTTVKQVAVMIAG